MPAKTLTKPSPKRHSSSAPVAPNPEYVCGFLFVGDHVVLLRKKRPKFQEGLLNGVGGKVEPKETHLQAMFREWKEEIGPGPNQWELFARVSFSSVSNGTGRVWFYWATASEKTTNALYSIVQEQPEDPTEKEIWEFFPFRLTEALRNRGSMPNLPWLIQMARTAQISSEKGDNEGLIFDAKETLDDSYADAD